MAASFFTFLIIVFTISPIPQLVLTRPNLIPPHISQLDTWIVHNMQDYDERKAAGQTTAPNFDPQLAAAEEAVQVITVRKDGTGNFTSVSDAVRSVPPGNTRRFVLAIGGGVYIEKVLVDASRPFVTFYGDQNDMPSIMFDGTALQYGTWNSSTVAVESDYFMAVNIAFVNSAPMPDGVKRGAQAVAMRISGDKAAFHNCKFIGFQDTLLDDRGRHFFKDCYIQGTVDFIFGNGKSLYLGNTLRSVANGTGVITAHARENVEDDSGFAFVHCNITGTGDTFLGRAWRERPRVVFAYTYMDSLINREGWSDATHKERDQTVYYGEYKCMGPGSSASGRVKYAKMLSDEEAKPFLSMTFIRGTKWVLPAPKL